jgi:hypothetical protein
MLMLHRLYSIQISGMRDTRTARSLFSTYNYTNHVTAVKQCQIRVLRINACIAICCRVVMSVYRSSRLRGKCTCLTGSACYNEISCDPAHVVTNQRQRAFVQQTVCIHIKTVIVLNQVLDEAVPFDTVYLISLQEAVEAVLIVTPRDRHALIQASHCEIRRCSAAGECG